MKSEIDDIRARVGERQDLDPASMTVVAEWLLDESANAADKADFLKKFHDKGETPGEIVALADAFLKRAVDPGLTSEDKGPVSMDVCGTGGDKLGLFNISTCSMFILAAAGVTVLKHGNRGVTSRSGGADVLEALGVSIDLPPRQLREMVARNGIGFLFAPHFHPAFRVIAPVRAQLAAEGRRTVFNILGPLLNPARPTHQLSGVFDPGLPAAYADILHRLGRKRAWAIHGTTADGAPMDEISTLGRTLVADASDGAIHEFTLDVPAKLAGRGALEQLTGGTAEENARLVEGILTGVLHGPKRDIVELNAAAALVVAGFAPDLDAGLDAAGDLLDSGKPHAKLRRLRGE